MSARERERLARLERLARAQETLAAAQRNRRHVAEAARRAAEADGEAMVAALSGDSPLHGVFIAATARLLRQNARERTARESEASAAARSEAVERLRSDRVGEQLGKARRAQQRRSDAAQLENAVAMRAANTALEDPGDTDAES